MLDVFYIFDFDNDLHRARQLAITGEDTLHPVLGSGDYDSIAQLPDQEIRFFIDGHISSTSCLVVLIGQATADHRWVKYAIGKARELDKPMMGVAIDKLKDADRVQGIAGPSPFTSAGMSPRALSQIEIYDPPFTTPVFARSHIRYNLGDWVEAAVQDNKSRQELKNRRFERKVERQREGNVG